MRIFLLGRTGQLGWELQRTLAPLGELIAFNHAELDLRQPEGVRSVIRRTKPDLIVNAAAYTQVDQAESEPEVAGAINGRAPGILAEEALEISAALVHFSTDYVFDGAKGGAYDEADQPNPLNVYGHSKLEGEKAIRRVGGAYLILRTSWVYSLRRDSFVTKVLEWARHHPTLRLVHDQVGSPTWSRMLAETTACLLAKGEEALAAWVQERQGLYHLAGDGIASRLEWAQRILELDPKREEQVVREIQPAETSEFPTPARRPLNSALACDRFADTFGLCLPPWEVALKLAMEGDST